MYVRECDKPGEEAFTELEAVVGLKGRTLLRGYSTRVRGSIGHVSGTASRTIPTRLGLRTGAIEGGLYASERLRGDYEALIALIAPTFEAMAARHRVDSSRPAIECYRRHDDFVLYLPIDE